MNIFRIGIRAKRNSDLIINDDNDNTLFLNKHTKSDIILDDNSEHSIVKPDGFKYNQSGNIFINSFSNKSWLSAVSGFIVDTLINKLAIQKMFGANSDIKIASSACVSAKSEIRGSLQSGIGIDIGTSLSVIQDVALSSAFGVTADVALSGIRYRYLYDVDNNRLSDIDDIDIGTLSYIYY